MNAISTTRFGSLAVLLGWAAFAGGDPILARVSRELQSGEFAAISSAYAVPVEAQRAISYRGTLIPADAPVPPYVLGQHPAMRFLWGAKKGTFVIVHVEIFGPGQLFETIAIWDTGQSVTLGGPHARFGDFNAFRRSVLEEYSSEQKTSAE